MPKALLVVVVTILLLLLSACAFQPPTTVAPTITSEVDNVIATPTPMPQPSATAVPSPTPEERASEYRDTWLCFAVEVPMGWTSEGVPGGFALFMPETGQSSFNVTNVSIEEPTLTAALAEVKRGSLGVYIQEVKDFTVGGRPALWVTFSPDNPDSSRIKLVVLVIAPDCGDGPHALFISATEADQGSFEMFLSHIRFI